MNPSFESKAIPAGACPAWRFPHRLARPASARGVPRRLRQALGALLVAAGLGVAAPPANALDVNQATAQQLEGIRGIGPRTAEIIVGERERGGKFDSFADLAERVRGIGLKKAQALESAGLRVGEGAPASVGAAGAANASMTAKPADRKPAPSPAVPSARPSALKAQGPSRP